MVGPSRWWYAAAAVVAFVGFAAAGALGVLAVVDYSERIDDLDRVPIFATEEVAFDAGSYTLYYEHPARSLVVVTPPVDPGFSCEGDFSPRFEEYDSDVTYGDGDREGTAVASFSIPAPARCTVRPTVPNDSQELGAQAAMGPSVHRGPVRQGLVAVAVALLTILTSAGLVLWVGLARVRATRSSVPPARPAP